MKKYKNIVLIVAAGTGSRFLVDVPKQYLTIKGENILRIVAKKFLAHPEIDGVVVVINKYHKALYKRAINGLDLLPCVYGGATRQESVRLGLEAIAEYDPQNVLIHDAARIFFDPNMISDIISNLEIYHAVTPGVKINDTVKFVKNGFIDSAIPRENLYAIQTPQCFKYQIVRDLHIKYKDQSVTDDVSLFEVENMHMVKVIESSIENFKITTAADFQLAKRLFES